MTSEQLIKLAEDFYGKSIELMKSKNADYSGQSQDALSNFKDIETLHIPAEVGFLTRMFDKFKRIASFVKNGELKVKDESVIDTLRDLANYACLMAAYLEAQKEEPFLDVETSKMGNSSVKSNEISYNPFNIEAMRMVLNKIAKGQSAYPNLDAEEVLKAISLTEENL